jgi:hypothetical protein
MLHIEILLIYYILVLLCCFLQEESNDNTTNHSIPKHLLLSSTLLPTKRVKKEEAVGGYTRGRRVQISSSRKELPPVEGCLCSECRRKNSLIEKGTLIKIPDLPEGEEEISKVLIRLGPVKYHEIYGGNLEEIRENYRKEGERRKQKREEEKRSQ